MKLKISDTSRSDFIKQYANLITEALLLDFLQPIKGNHEQLKDCILGSKGNEFVETLMESLLTGDYTISGFVYSTYKNMYLSMLAPLSGSNISCSCMLLGKFGGTFSARNMPLAANYSPNLGMLESLKESNKLKAKYFLLGLLLNCLHHSIVGHSSGACNTEVVFIRGENRYSFYFDLLKNLDLDFITIDYTNTNTGRSLTKIIFNVNDICNKMLSEKFNETAIASLLMFNLDSVGVPDLYVALSCYADLYSKYSSQFNKSYVNRRSKLKLSDLERLANIYNTNIPIKLADTELISN